MKLRIFIIALLLISGCASERKMRKLESDLNSLRFRIDEANERISMVEKEIEDISRACGILKTAQDELIKEIYAIRTSLNETREFLYSVQSNIQEKKSTESPESLYKRATELFNSNKCSSAIPIFESIIKNFPKHSLADNALYWIGECYYRDGLKDKSLETMKEVIRRYPSGNKVPDAKIKMAVIYMEAGEENKAIELLKDVIEKTSDEDAKMRANALLEKIKNKPSGGER
jgi:tol-pal system protein YbgF